MTFIPTDFYPTIAERNHGISVPTQKFLRKMVRGFDGLETLTSASLDDQIKKELADAPAKRVLTEDHENAHQMLAGVYYNPENKALTVRSYDEGMSACFTTEITATKDALSIRTYFKKGDLNLLTDYLGKPRQTQDGHPLATLKLSPTTGIAEVTGMFVPGGPKLWTRQFSPNNSDTITVKDAALIASEIKNLLTQMAPPQAAPTRGERGLPTDATAQLIILAPRASR